MSDLIDRQELLRQIDIDADGEPGYYGDTWKFIDTIKSMPPAELGTNLAEVGTDCISRQQAIDYFVTNVGFHDEDGYPIEDTDELRKIWTEYFSGIQPAQPATNCSEFPNNSDAISRQAAIDALTEYGNGRAVFISVGEAVIRIEQLPPIQPKRGKWIRTGSGSLYDHYECSECGKAPK